MASSSSSSQHQPLDIEALLSRDFRPARVAQLQPKEKYGIPNSERRRKTDDSNRRRNSAWDPSASRGIVHALVQGTYKRDSNWTQTPPAPLRPYWGASATSATTNINNAANVIPTHLHEIEIGDWERCIQWGDNNSEDNDQQTSTDEDNGSAIPTPVELSKRARNPYLENLVLDDSNIGWTPEDCKQIVSSPKDIPLILQWGVAGRSVARYVHQHDFLASGSIPQHPSSALKSEEYQERRQKESGSDNAESGITSTAVLKKNKSLHQDKDQMAAFIEKRQKLRAQMAKDKTNRVTEAMGTLALGVSGKGRTITSSLMGPGGTERSGRPTTGGGSGGYQAEYIEQLDIVANHALVRDLSKILLRQYHRPKLPLAVVRPGNLLWQFQARKDKFKKEGSHQVGGPGPGIMMMHTGAASLNTKIRTESDLSPTEGKVVLLEYCEERPLVQLTKGMASKIINYYRGDKAHCPVSAGGGDRPARRKRETTDKDSSTSNGDDRNGDGNTSSAAAADRLPRLSMAGGGDKDDNIMDWVGKLPSKRTSVERSEQDAIDILPEGVTEILHPKVHGPFIGEIEEGHTITGLVSNMFVAPMFRHAPETTDFLMILQPPSGAARPGQRDHVGVVLRDLPSSVYTVGQIEPRVRVHAPNSQGEKSFVGPFVSYQIARALTRSQGREGHGLRFDELQHSVCPNLELAANALRQRLKQVAIYDKNTSIWTTKQIGFDDYPGVEALGKSISPEGIAAFEIASAASRRLTDLGIHTLFAGAHSAVSVGVAVFYLKAQLSATRELAKQVGKMLTVSRNAKSMTPTKIALYEAAAAELDQAHKTLKQKIEVAQFIYEQLLLAPWHLTGDFLDVHKKGEGTGMLKLTGLGDPSGNGEGFSFLREVDSKPSKSVGGNAALSAQVKKITGTEDDLRKLTMKQMASLLRSYGMGQKQIDTLKRWDRVHVIRDLSTKAASDGIGDGLERFARGEKMKLSEQKQMYRDRIRVIWRRQIAALGMADNEKTGGGADGQGNEADKKADKDAAAAGSDSDSEDDDDFFAAELEDEMMDRAETNQLVADRAATNPEGEVNRGQMRAAMQDKSLTKEARELAQLKKQREEERAAQGGLNSGGTASRDPASIGSGRKVIRRKTVITHPDGKQTTTFKYILKPAEVGKIQAKLDAADADENGPLKSRPFKHEANSDERPPGQATWEDDDDIEYASGGRGGNKRRGARGRRGGGRTTPKGGLQFGKLKTKISAEERLRKRRREEDEMDTYIPTSKRKGTSNRRERGSIRDRRPHVIFADRLEAIRAAIEARVDAGPFIKPVSSKLVPKYYETISDPIDLSAIRDKIKRYDYRSSDAMLKDFELMKNNAIKFNGPQNRIALSAIAIYEFAANQVESCRSELSALEVAVGEQLSDPKPKKKKSGSKKSKVPPTGATANVDGFAVNLGNISSFKFDGDSDSGDEVSFTGE